MRLEYQKNAFLSTCMQITEFNQLLATARTEIHDRTSQFSYTRKVLNKRFPRPTYTNILYRTGTLLHQVNFILSADIHIVKSKSIITPTTFKTDRSNV